MACCFAWRSWSREGVAVLDGWGMYASLNDDAAKTGSRDGGNWVGRRLGDRDEESMCVLGRRREGEK